ncbi:cytokinin dehydrogenase 3-like protein [Tanacetum coccineum]|uniref:Cytokinin dehydrogenase 3-like protein n=1 Tax=Tanacetum coccineum TaxID=301880 RepID=A0ABQ5FU50_9ASTR
MFEDCHCLLGLPSDGTRNDVGPVGDISTVMEGVTPSMIDMTMEKEKLSPLDDTIVPGSFPPLPMQVTTSAGNAPGKSSYANITSKPSGKKVMVRTLYTPENLLKEDVKIVPVWVKLHGVPVTTFSEDGLSAIATKLGTPLMLDSYTSDMCMQSWDRSSYARVIIEIRADVELKDNIGMAMPKITKEGHYICTGEKKTVKKPSQTSRGVPIGVEPTIEVSNSNPLDVLNLVDNDVEFGTNRGATNLVNNGATSSGSSSMNIDNDEEFASNTLIGKKIDKIERQICEGKLRLLDNDRNPLVPTGIVESDSEVEVVFDETANLRISTSGKDRSDKGYGTNSFLKQWRDSYLDNDDYDPYNDDMYMNHDLSMMILISRYFITKVVFGNKRFGAFKSDKRPLVDQTNAVNWWRIIPTITYVRNYVFWGNIIDVVVPVESIRAVSDKFANSAYGFFLGQRVKLHGVPITAFREDGLSAIATKLGTPIMLDSYTVDICMHSWGRSSYARAMIKLQADVELKDTIMVAMPKIYEKGWSVPRILAWVRELVRRRIRKTLIKLLKVFSGNKKKGVDSTSKVSDSNPFEVLNSVDNDNVENSSTSTTPVMDKIRKFENLVIDGQAILVDEAGNPLKKVECSGDHDSDDEVTSVDNDMTRDLASERTGFGTQSLLEQ